MLLWAGFLSISFSLFLVTVAVHAQEDGTELRHYVVNLTGTRSPFRSGMWGTIMGSGHAALGNLEVGWIHPRQKARAEKRAVKAVDTAAQPTRCAPTTRSLLLLSSDLHLLI